jgi:hypothetical protein
VYPDDTRTYQLERYGHLQTEHVHFVVAAAVRSFPSTANEDHGCRHWKLASLTLVWGMLWKLLMCVPNVMFWKMHSLDCVLETNLLHR